jgi:hypothetical protein
MSAEVGTELSDQSGRGRQHQQHEMSRQSAGGNAQVLRQARSPGAGGDQQDHPDGRAGRRQCQPANNHLAGQLEHQQPGTYGNHRALLADRATTRLGSMWFIR